MKISKLFHLLYFAVLSLPILAIPAFGIYSHRHVIDSYTVEQQEVEVVDFNQLNTGLFVDFDNQEFNGVVFNTHENRLFIDINGTASSTVDILVLNQTYVNFYSGHVYYFKSLLSGTNNSIRLYSDLYDGTHTSYGVNGSSLFTATYDYKYFLSYILVSNGSSNISFSDISLQIFDFTQMFGIGNEPTIEQFNLWFPNNYYAYTLSDKQLLYTGNTINYNDTDIGSQLIYTSYNTVNNYFNYDKVFNFGALYDWLQVNFFVGNAPLGFFIFWHLLIYWLLTSLLWLLFDVLIYVPMVIHKWLDKASL